MLGVNAIQRHVVTHACEIDAGAHDIVETLAGRLENRREILEDALRLGHNTPLDQLASGRVLRDLSAEVEETTDFDRVRKGADRRREFRRGNCGFAHGKLRWILVDLVRMVEPEIERALSLAQALLTRPGLTDLDRCPVQNLGTASLTNLNRLRHQVSTNEETPCSLNGEPIIPQVHYSHDDVAVSARFCYSMKEDSGELQEVHLLDELLALVEFAQAGSIAGAAYRLYRTPSAVTRQLQRLEAAMGAELLDRSVKPPRLNALGSRVLEQARDLLQRTEALKSLASSDAEPHGLLRIGLSHPLAEGTLIDPILALTEKYPKVRLRLLSELTGELFNRLLAGELDVAAVLLPEGKTAPPPLLTNIIASDRMEIAQGAAGNVDGDWKSLGKAPWVLNPPGCPLRARLIDRMERDGFTPMIAAEIHNMHLQLAFVQSGYGVGLLPARFIARNHSADTVAVLRPPSFDLRPSVAIVRAGQLGALGKAVELLEHRFRQLLGAADTTKPVTRHRRGAPTKRRAVRSPR